ncbi:BrnT family toxin [Desulfosarcina variabilis]|uniref:BrnT family toxin n=1 Tax=Desulfosarcina variabilis TaxID=2300 RepID=UPI003AFAC7ED
MNFKKHGVRFSDAEFVLFDPFAMTLEDHWVAGEKRFVTVGSDAVGRIITVVYIYTVQITSV